MSHWFWEDESEQAQREHNEAQKEGAEANPLDQALHAGLSGLYSDAHNAGWDNGVANPSSSDSSSGDSDGGCFLTTACVRAGGLPDDCDELVTLRQFRDDVMMPNPQWRALVMEYYRTAPAIVARTNRRQDAESVWADALASVRRVVSLIKSDHHAAAVATYRAWAESIAAQ